MSWCPTSGKWSNQLLLFFLFSCFSCCTFFQSDLACWGILDLLRIPGMFFFFPKVTIRICKIRQSRACHQPKVVFFHFIHWQFLNIIAQVPLPRETTSNHPFFFYINRFFFHRFFNVIPNHFPAVDSKALVPSRPDSVAVLQQLAALPSADLAQMAFDVSKRPLASRADGSVERNSCSKCWNLKLGEVVLT